MKKLKKPLIEKIKIFRELEKISENRPYLEKPKFIPKPKKPIKYNPQNFSIFNNDEPSDYWYWLILFLPFWYLIIIFEFLFSIPETLLISKFLIFILIVLCIKIIQYVNRFSEHKEKVTNIKKEEETYSKERNKYKKYLLTVKNYEKENEIDEELDETILNLENEIINDFKEQLKQSEDILLNGELAKKYKIQDIMSSYVRIKSSVSRAKAHKKYREELYSEKISVKNKKNQLKEIQKFYDKEISQIAKRIDLSDDEKVNKIINIYSLICATVAIQPIPFADIFILSPIQIIMGNKIGEIRGYKLLDNKIENIFKEVSGTFGLGLIAQQLALGAYKTIIPFYGAITTIPMVYGLTYGIGKVMDYYVLAKMTNKIPNKEEMKRIYKKSKKEGEKLGKSKENGIKENPTANNV